MDNKYILDTAENKDFLNINAQALLDFGRQFPSPGGGSYYLSDTGTPWKDHNRETWITCRMAHVYSIGAMMGDKGSRELAAAAIRGLRGELKDKKNGGWYAGLTMNDEVVENKQCYAHAFVILAGTSAYLAGIEGAKELLDEALEIYDRYFWNEKEGLSCDTWNTEFTVLDDYRGVNANMHTVEAFLAVADALDDDKYRVRAGRIIDHVIEWAKDNSYRIPEHFTTDWEPDLEKNRETPDDPFKPYGATPGHGIEWARLITQWCTSSYPVNDEMSGGSKREFYVSEACKLYDRAIADAWNVDGAEGIVYTTDWNGKPVVHDRMHWTLAEAINTSAVLYRVTGNKKYADDYAGFMKYLDEVVLDHNCGSWFHQLDEHNKLKGTVWPGKSDLYHAFQAMLIPYSEVDISIAKAVRFNIMKKEMLDHLADDIIPFWLGLKDDEYGGFYGLLSYDLKLDKRAVKGCILNSRILWFFSNVWLLIRDGKLNVPTGKGIKETDIQSACRHAYDFLRNHFYDEENGGVFWSCEYDGEPADDTKHTYNQAFAIYALASYYDASGEENAIKLASSLRKTIEDKCRDKDGYLEAFTHDFRPAGNEKLSENGVEAYRTMNTLLHVFEAYSGYLKVIKKKGCMKEEQADVEANIRFMLDIIGDKIYNPELKRQEVFFDKDYNSLIDLHSYGHDIETSWLVDAGLDILNDASYTKRIRPLMRTLADKIYERAYVDHSLMNECEKGVDDTKRVWWVQAETVLGFVNAYRRSRETGEDAMASRYLAAAEDVWDYIKDKIIDKRSGSEWFSQVDKNGVPDASKDIVEPWKCPYHNGRMCMFVQYV